MSSKVVGQKFLALLVPSVFSFSVFADDIQPTPSDMGLVNEERIEYWLKRKGEISADSTLEERDAALRKFIKADKIYEQNQLIESSLPKPYEKSHSHASQLNAPTQTPQPASSQETTVKVLGILIEFPDYKQSDNKIGRGDTRMYYSSYPRSHYMNMMYSTTGYAGPSGQTLRSVYQHYKMASGDTFFFTGTIKGWYEAENKAAYYGAPSGNSNDSRVPELIFEAASQAAASMSASELAEYDVEDPYDLDNDDNLFESDGIIDHVMVYHSSIGQEAGGGDLGENAIWSHRHVVQGSSRGKALPGTTKKVYNYTIQPIDATVGLVSHEFGHELGLVDEYDTSRGAVAGAPVGYWSLMGQGTWGGNPQGTEPLGFSPLARNQLQERMQGNWVREQTIDFSSLSDTSQDFIIHEAVNTEETNQLAITLPLVNGESKPRKYLIQLRSKNGIDVGLSSRKYEPGLLIWQHDTNQTNNQIQNRAGKPMIGVIDADQNLIGNERSRVQVRDATFSLYDQSPYSNDRHLNNKATFDDSHNYVASQKPQAGLSLVSHGISISVVEQAPDHTSARIRVTREGASSEGVIRQSINADGSITFSISVTGDSRSYTYAWEFGDGNSSTEVSPTHTYATDGNYQVTVAVTDSNNVSVTASRNVVINSNPIQPDTNDEPESSSSSGGSIGLISLLLLALLRFRKQV